MGTSDAAYVCLTADAVTSITQLGNENAFDDASPAAAQRRAIIEQLLRQYCTSINATPPFDYSQQLDSFCMLFSGVLSDKRVFWVHCRSCGEAPGEQCE
jgi:hypothetical protein